MMYWDRRLLAGMPSQASASRIAHAVTAPVGRLDAGGPSRRPAVHTNLFQASLEVRAGCSHWLAGSMPALPGLSARDSCD